MTLNCYKFKFSRNFALLRILETGRPIHQGCYALTFALFRLSCYIAGTILIRRNIYTIMFNFSLKKSMVRVRLELRLRDRVGFLLMYITGFLIKLIIIAQSNFIGMDCYRKLQSSQRRSRGLAFIQRWNRVRIFDL